MDLVKGMIHHRLGDCTEFQNVMCNVKPASAVLHCAYSPELDDKYTFSSDYSKKWNKSDVLFLVLLSVFISSK